MRRIKIIILSYALAGGTIINAQVMPTDTTIITGEFITDFFGAGVAIVNDINADGIKDILISATHNDAGGQDAGRVYVFWGNASISGNLAASQANIKITGENSDDYFGSIASAGDVNGDGINDIIMGSIWNDTAGENAGRAYIFFGRPGFSGNFDATQADVIINGRAAYAFGYPAVTVGDLNNDGFDDVAITAYFYLGRVYIFWGGANFSGIYDVNSADVTIIREFGGDRLGFSVTPAGDFNRDGIDDLIIGAPNYDGNSRDIGRVYIFYGGTGLSGNINASQANLIITGEDFEDYLGYSVSSAGDINNDGTKDIIIASAVNDRNGINTGTAYVFLGGSGIRGNLSASNANILFLGDSQSTGYAMTVSLGGDMNKDGINDIIVGGAYHSTVGANEGRIYIYFIDKDRTGIVNASEADIVVTGRNSGDAISSEFSVGDIDNDGFDDLIVATGSNRVDIYRKFTDIQTAIENESIEQVPTKFALFQNYPNPFNTNTIIGFHLPVSSHVRIEIFNLLGQKVKTLVDEKRHAGSYELTRNARNDSGEKIPSGVYVLRMRAKDFVQTRKLVVLE